MTWFLFGIVLYCIVLSQSNRFESSQNNINTRQFSGIRLNPIRKYLDKTEFRGKFKETFREKTPNEYQKKTRERSKILRNQLRQQMKKSRFEIKDPKKIAQDLSWVQVDNQGNQIEFDISANDISNIVNNMESKRHSIEINFNDLNINRPKIFDGITQRRRTYVMGQDNRYRVADMSRSPPKHVGLIKFRSGNDNNNDRYSFGSGFGSLFSFGGGWGRSERSYSWQQCTGTLIGPRHVLTAGHCVHEGKNGDWYSDFRFYLGGIENSDSENYYGWSDIKAINCWVYDSDFDCDFGLLILNSEPDIGYMKIGYDDELSDDMWFVGFGYPTKSQNQLWLTGCYLWEISESNLRDIECDIEPGQSGSALSTWVNDERIIYGIVSNENYISESNGWLANKQYFNQHTRINKYVYTTLCYWIEDDGYRGIC